MSERGEATREQTVQSVDRAVSILQSLARLGPSGVTDIAAEVGLHKATAHRLLATLEVRGLVSQDVDRGSYRLGRTVVQLAAAATRPDDVVSACRPLCDQLAAEVGDTVNLVVSDGSQIITVYQAVGEAIVVSRDFVGKHDPLHATAAGKVFLAHQPTARVDELAGAGLERFTPSTIVDPRELRAELERVRERGWAITTEEHEVGLVVIAAPVRSADGSLAAAMTVSGPTYRVTEATLPGLVERLLDSAQRAGWRLGALRRG
ncbi:IclR family transcriptional regulator [uncultured Pseudokineococcus sp.]|uniref:IclR family transcriptional regulator n=1 Tax=uncultured Pseudokineococcus sp. TaxID=1642928 RepID=UPI0026278F4E|nr:IclR family transcriptional regulator [uncultured Pseudokineococcus sp.]